VVISQTYFSINFHLKNMKKICGCCSKFGHASLKNTTATQDLGFLGDHDLVVLGLRVGETFGARDPSVVDVGVMRGRSQGTRRGTCVLGIVHVVHPRAMGSAIAGGAAENSGNP
jgi:hypothetical protein